jgi:hypothetical protein
MVSKPRCLAGLFESIAQPLTEENTVSGSYLNNSYVLYTPLLKSRSKLKYISIIIIIIIIIIIMVSGKFPQVQPDWANFAVIHRNVLPPRTSFFNYATPADALSYEQSKSQTFSLNGIWKINVVDSPFEAPSDFFSSQFDTSKWADVKVPSMWQLEGFGKPHYTNVVYPFPVDPPHGMPARDQCQF